MTILKTCIVTLVVIPLIFIQSVSSQNKYDFSKNGEVHKQVIYLWDSHYRDYFTSEIKRRLFQDKDVYVLYDVQIGGLQSFVEMTRRCKDLRQISELVDLLNPVFSFLKPLPTADSSIGWICSGGSICKDYGLLGNEVVLCSSQFLGLIGALATNIVENIPSRQQSVAERAFLSNTFSTIAIHLDRWFSINYYKSITRRLPVDANNLEKGSTGYIYTDKDLWYLTALSDLSELQQMKIQPSADGKDAFDRLQKKKDAIKEAFNLFLNRTFLTLTSNEKRAEIDKGFWRYFSDNRYARYTGSVSPVIWEKDSNGKSAMKTQVEWDSSYLAPDVAWDISHARRLVPALETFVRNQENIKSVWDYDNPAFDPVALRQAYANQVVGKIWNSDLNYPLFSNFWSGDNGWYRVAYAAKETGRQFVGYPPYGLSISIPNGGYAIWSGFQPTLRIIFKNIFELSQTDNEQAKSFVLQHYNGLLRSRSENISTIRIQDLSFLSDLIELPLKSGNDVD